MNMRTIAVPRLAVLVVAVAASASASAETRKVVAGPQYAKSGLHKWLFGADYRALWTTPATFEVLDLATEAGGLTPVARVGGQQTKGLALKGRDGRNYTFRGLDKDASEILDEELRDTIVDDIVEDQQAAQHPASEVVARGLLDATGVACPPWRLVVLPDDPALGEFRKDFAGAVGDVRRVPEREDRDEPGLPRHHRDHRPARALPALAGGRGRSGRRAGPAQGPADGHLHGRLGPPP